MNEKEIFTTDEDWLNSGLDIAIVTVIQTWGSSPRPVGSSMVINSNHDIVYTNNTPIYSYLKVFFNSFWSIWNIIFL